MSPTSATPELMARRILQRLRLRLIQTVERVAHRAGRTYGPHSMIRLIERRTEHGQHGVPDELVECAVELEDHLGMAA